MKHNQYVLENDMKPDDVQELVQEECEKWSKKGRNIHYISRDNRNGYKAGALKEAMDLDYVKKCDYVAIFDADHEPPSDFLMRTIPFLIHNPEIGLVQARWKFGRVNEWVVTEKAGNASKTIQTSTAAKKCPNKFWKRSQIAEEEGDRPKTHRLVMKKGSSHSPHCLEKTSKVSNSGGADDSIGPIAYGFRKNRLESTDTDGIDIRT
ncbi:hypothetical protein B296_00038491 [Ensete ventricosum]|uniref:Glycosyltransferase 2-like domain-containing protein n=1 Tax=Ensete ventricosum TaxID=4639 RepID=A0A426ZRU3_ENSVE|nr:hypothetical protein B296_00038491 [Ensete ventricosum]